MSIFKIPKPIRDPIFNPVNATPIGPHAHNAQPGYGLYLPLVSSAPKTRLVPPWVWFLPNPHGHVLNMPFNFDFRHF